MGIVGAFLDEIYNSISKMDFSQETKEAIFLKIVDKMPYIQIVTKEKTLKKQRQKFNR
jgi:hypothetical protein